MNNLIKLFILSEGITLCFTIILLYKYFFNKKTLKTVENEVNRLVFKLANSYEENLKLENKIIELSKKIITPQITKTEVISELEKNTPSKKPNTFRKPRNTKKIKE
jgi:uncharacterized membrane protein